MLTSMRRVLVGVLVGVALLVLFEPAFEGYHFGYNSATDSECRTQLGIQWCKAGTSTSSPAPSAPTTDQPAATTPTPTVPAGDKIDRTGFACYPRYYNAKRDLCMVP